MNTHNTNTSAAIETLSAYGWVCTSTQHIPDIAAEQSEWDNSPARLRALHILNKNTHTAHMHTTQAVRRATSTRRKRATQVEKLF